MDTCGVCSSCAKLASASVPGRAQACPACTYADVNACLPHMRLERLERLEMVLPRCCWPARRATAAEHHIVGAKAAVLSLALLDGRAFI